MRSQIRPMITLFGLLTFLTGVLYPLLMTAIAQAIFPHQANGSPLYLDNNLAGSALIGQAFTSEQYFWGRPSSTSGSPYNAFDPEKLTGSAGSNLGPLSQTLYRSVEERADHLRSTTPCCEGPIPVDLVTSSASGLDPDISIESAFYQLTRVAQARGLEEMELMKLIEMTITPRQFGFLGEPRVNVMQLNLALDGLQ